VSLTIQDIVRANYSNVGTGCGETNTTSTKGLGEGLTLPKEGVDLPFKSITAGANITLTASAEELEISSSGGGGAEYFPLKANNGIIFLFVTGQSNPQGLEPNLGGSTVPGWVPNPNVWAWSTSGLNTTTDGQVFLQTANDWQWRNNIDLNSTSGRDATPSAGYANMPRDWYGFEPYVGPILGGRGDQAIVAADRLQKITGDDVYVVSITQGGAGIEWWDPAFNNTIGQRSVIEWITNVFGHILSTGPLFDAGITAPDIISWGQSEGNAGASTEGYLTPDECWTEWKKVYDAADGVWSDNSYTQWLLTEPTQFVNWDGTGVDGGDAYPWRWEGLNKIVRETNERVRLVSSNGIEYGDGGVTQPIHYTSAGNVQYGEMIGRVAVGATPAQAQTSTNLENELSPTLSNAARATGLDANNKPIFGASDYVGPVSNIDLMNTERLAVSPPADFVVDTDAMILLSGTHTYTPVTGFLRGYMDLTEYAQDGPVSSSNISAQYVSPTVTNAGGVDTTSLSAVQGTSAFPKWKPMGFSLSVGGSVGLTTTPITDGASTGTIVMSSWQGVLCNHDLNAGDTLTLQTGVSVYEGIVGNEATTITNNIGYYVGSKTAGVNANFDILIGAGGLQGSLFGPRLPAGVTGNWGLYQSDTHNNHWGGGEQKPYVEVPDSAQVALDGTHRYVNGAPNAGSHSILLPLAADYPNQVYNLRNSGSGGMNINTTGGNALVGIAGVLSAGSTGEIISDGVNTWYAF
jgi:hypothetical protein